MESGHSPNLQTILMVEETLKKSGELISVAEIKRKLPRKSNAPDINFYS